MPHRIDKARIAERDVSKTAVQAAIARLSQIEGASGATAAQVRAAVQDMARMLKHIIKLLA